MKAALTPVLMMSLLQVAHGLFFGFIGDAIDWFFWHYLVFFGMKFNDMWLWPQNFFKRSADRLEERSLVTEEGLTRWFLEHQPIEGVKDGAALVIYLHSGPGSMYEAFYYKPTRRLLELCDQRGFLLLTPNGTFKGFFGRITTRGNGVWNDLLPTLPGAPFWVDSKQDDVAFLSEVVA